MWPHLAEHENRYPAIEMDNMMAGVFVRLNITCSCANKLAESINRWVFPPVRAETCLLLMLLHISISLFFIYGTTNPWAPIYLLNMPVYSTTNAFILSQWLFS